MSEELKRYKAEIEKIKIDSEHTKPAREAVFRFAELALKSLLILNGGAAIAVLAYASNTKNTAGLWPIVASFCIGQRLPCSRPAFLILRKSRMSSLPSLRMTLSVAGYDGVRSPPRSLHG